MNAAKSRFMANERGFCTVGFAIVIKLEFAPVANLLTDERTEANTIRIYDHTPHNICS